MERANLEATKKRMAKLELQDVEHRNKYNTWKPPESEEDGSGHEYDIAHEKSELGEDDEKSAD